MTALENNENLPESERRKSVRLEINAVTRFISDGQVGVGTTRLINLGGLLMDVEQSLPLGGKIEMYLNLPTDIQVFCAKGEIVFTHNARNRKSHAGNEVGIRFKSLDKNSEKILNEFTDRYNEFKLQHSIYSKEMSIFSDPTIIKVPEDLKRNRS